MSYLSLGGTNEDSAEFMASPGKGIGAPGNSNLSALFGLNNQINNNPNSNQALTYTAPKPPGKAAPKQQQSAGGGGGGSGVACAVAVTAYRLVNGQNAHQGKLGAAILKNVAEKDFKILMYVTKQQPVSTTQINPSFQFTIQPNNYASFNDDQKQTWTILFATTAQLHEFAKQICIAKFFTSPETAVTNVVQDLVHGDSQKVAVESGDSLEMKYSGWLVNNDGSIGAVFDSNHNSEKTFRFKSGRGKVIKGWETGMIGMRSGGKRFLVIPPHLAYGQKAVGNKIPPNSTLSFEVDLLRVKQSKDNASVKSGESIESLPQAVAVEQPAPPNPVSLPAVESPLTQPENAMQQETTVKGRTASLNEQFSNVPGDSSKNALVSRMARMGHAMLPVSGSTDGAVPVEQAPINVMPAHEPTPPTRSPNISQPMSRPSTPGYNPIQPAPMQQVPQNPQYQAQPAPLHPQPQQLHPSQQSYHSPQHYPNLAQNQMMASHPSQGIQGYFDPAAMSSNPAIDPSTVYNQHSMYRQTNQFPQSLGYGADMMPVLLSETKQQSSEVRLLQEKVDKVSGMVEEVKKLTEDAHSNKPKLSASQTMDAEVIMLNVQRIMKENEELKQTISQKNQRIEQQSEKISDLLQQNQKYVEKSNMMLEQRNDSFKESFTQSQARSLQLEQDKVELTQRLSDSSSKVSELTLEITSLKERDNELRQKFKDVYGKTKERAETAEEKIAELEEKLSESDKSLQSVTSSGANAKSQVDELQEEVVTLKQKQADQIEVMNESIAKLRNDKSALEERLKEVQSSHRRELEELRSNSETANLKSHQQSEEVNALTEKLNVSQSQYEEVQESLEASEQKITLFQQRFGQLRTAFEEQKSKLEDATSEAEELSPYKEAYNRLRRQAAAMKEKYDEKILELKQELESKEENVGGDERANVVDEVKKIMNVIFQRVRSKIDTDDDYAGAEVLKIMIEIIKSTTLSLLTSHKQESKESEDEESSGGEEESSEPDKTVISSESPETTDPPQIEEISATSVSDESAPQTPLSEEKLEIVKPSVSEKPQIAAKPAISAPKPKTTPEPVQTCEEPDTEPQEVVESPPESIQLEDPITQDSASRKESGDPPEEIKSPPEATSIEENEPIGQEEDSISPEKDVNLPKEDTDIQEKEEDQLEETEASPNEEALDQVCEIEEKEENVEKPPDDDVQEPDDEPQEEETSSETKEEETATKEESSGDFVLVEKADEQPDNKAEAEDKLTAETVQQEENKIENQTTESQPSETTVPAVERQSSSESSISDDRKPPPLFDDESDGDDLDWLS